MQSTKNKICDLIYFFNKMHHGRAGGDHFKRSPCLIPKLPILQPRLPKLPPELFPSVCLFKLCLSYPVEHVGIFPVAVDCCPAAVDVPTVMVCTQLYL